MAQRIVKKVMTDATVIEALKPYCIKSPKTFHGHDGDGYLQGNLYKGNKAIGTFAQDAWGGEMNMSIKNEALHKDFMELVETFPAEECQYSKTGSHQYSTESVIENMIANELENRALKRKCKNKTLVRTTENTVPNSFFEYRCAFTPVTKKQITKMVEEQGHKIVEFINERFV